MGRHLTGTSQRRVRFGKFHIVQEGGMTMKLSKTFLTGILALMLVFGITLTGCDNGSTSGGGGGGGGNALVGSWVNDRDNPARVVIFTNVADAAIAGANVAYWSTLLTPENTPASGSEVFIGGTPYSFTVNGNTLTITAYGEMDAMGNRPNVTFNRAKGSSGTTMHGVWISDLPSGNLRYTLLIIRTGSAKTYTAVTSARWGASAYSLSSDANTTYIKWGNSNPTAYTKYSDPTSLNVPTPGGLMDNLVAQTTW
jgi:hypothetical protein